MENRLSRREIITRVGMGALAAAPAVILPRLSMATPGPVPASLVQAQNSSFQAHYNSCVSIGDTNIPIAQSNQTSIQNLANYLSSSGLLNVICPLVATYQGAWTYNSASVQSACAQAGATVPISMLNIYTTVLPQVTPAAAAAISGNVFNYRNTLIHTLFGVWILDLQQYGYNGVRSHNRVGGPCGGFSQAQMSNIIAGSAGIGAVGVGVIACSGSLGAVSGLGAAAVVTGGAALFLIGAALLMWAVYSTFQQKGQPCPAGVFPGGPSSLILEG